MAISIKFKKPDQMARVPFEASMEGTTISGWLVPNALPGFRLGFQFMAEPSPDAERLINALAQDKDACQKAAARIRAAWDASPIGIISFG